MVCRSARDREVGSSIPPIPTGERSSGITIPTVCSISHSWWVSSNGKTTACEAVRCGFESRYSPWSVETVNTRYAFEAKRIGARLSAERKRVRVPSLARGSDCRFESCWPGEILAVCQSVEQLPCKVPSDKGSPGDSQSSCRGSNPRGITTVCALERKRDFHPRPLPVRFRSPPRNN